MTHNLLTAEQVRPIVHSRQGGLCARCWEPLGSWWEAHHRRKRAILDWCPCNIVALHPRCHTQGPSSPERGGQWAVHDHPTMAQAFGLIVPSWLSLDRPVSVEVQWPWTGPAMLSCDGDVVSLAGAEPPC